MSEPLQKINKLIAVYGRVSTSNQENEGTIETQLSAVNEYAQDRGYVIAREYIDNGWSGDSIVRPALDQLRVDARKKIWEAVLIYDPDRLARRYSYQELVMDELKEAGVEVIFVTVTAPKNSEDKILYGVRGLFAEYERTKIAERFRLGKLRKVKEGHILVSEPLYGYRYIPKVNDKHGYYEINEEEAKVVRMIFTWIAEEGLNIRSVVKRLQEQEIKPRKSKRGVWNTSTLTTMLRNKAYIGEARWGSSYAVVPKNPIKKERYKKIKKTSRRTKPESEWIIIPVPVIIDKELFLRTRKQLKTNLQSCKRNTRNEYLLTSKIYCTCGRRRCGEGPQKGKYLYYRCNDRIMSFPLPRKCKEKGINARISDKLVWDKIVKLMCSPELLMKQANRWFNSQKVKTQSSVGDVGIINEEISKLKGQTDRYNKAYGAGVISMDQLKEYVTPINKRISVLQSQVLQAKQKENQISSVVLPDKKDLETFSEGVRKVLENLSFSLKKNIITNIVDKIVGDQQQLKIYGYIPITPNNYVKFKTSDWNCRTT